MNKHIVMDINPWETRVALLHAGDAEEIYVERPGKERQVGNIYKGRVANVLPGMQAAFVDIGQGKNAFLYAGDVLADTCDFVFDGAAPEPLDQPIEALVKQGQEITVQIVKDAVGSKGARVTTHISLPGRLMVLMPTMKHVGVSRRISSEEERQRLRTLLEKLKPDNMGLIVRTAGENKQEADFQHELTFLTRLWQHVQKLCGLVSAPRLMHSEESLIFRTLRDIFQPDVEKLSVNDSNTFEKLQMVCGITAPEMLSRIELVDAGDLFDHYGVNLRMHKMLSRKVWLKSGGYIVIDPTEALCVIDVNTGKYVGQDSFQRTVLATNLEAAREIARQIRLRNLSGIIVVDFIDMEGSAHKEQVLGCLREAVRQDHSKVNVLGMTQLGLVEMTRKKMHQSLSNCVQITCPYCKGETKVQSPESTAIRICKSLLRAFAHEDSSVHVIYLHRDTARYIRKASQDKPYLPVSPGKTTYLAVKDELLPDEFEIKGISPGRELDQILSENSVFS